MDVAHSYSHHVAPSLNVALTSCPVPCRQDIPIPPKHERMAATGGEEARQHTGEGEHDLRSRAERGDSGRSDNDP